jgi:GT2 family glycosyltransferase
MATPELPSFDLVVATIGRVGELERLFDSLGKQTHSRFRVLLVDQNEDDRLSAVSGRDDLEIIHLRSKHGLSRARNRALRELASDLVAFPDDDCFYQPDLLERVAARFVGDPTLDGLTGRAVSLDGTSSPSWKTDVALLTDDNLWNRAISYTIFLRRKIVAAVGDFDEQLGLGSGTPWSSGEEIDYLVRAIRTGGRIAYDPELTVTHNERSLSPSELRDRGYRDGASIGYMLRKHRYPRRVIARMMVRPAGGVVVALLRRDAAQTGFQRATLWGRLAGLRGAS